MNYLLVFLGAGFGGGLRYFISNNVSKILPIYFPFGTLLVNIIGSIFLGFLIFGLDDKELLSNNLKVLLGVGFCGGLTTFLLLSHWRQLTYCVIHNFYLPVLNIFLNVAVTLFGIYLAYIFTK
ncbi:MAG: CrcB family protein [Ignavibacteriales bacterium]|nr:CrcB family protein [Ignavibacteriales bacterium]